MTTANAPLPLQAGTGLDLRPIAGPLGLILVFLGASMLLPALADHSESAKGADAFLGTAAVTVFVGVLMWLAGRSADPIQKLDLRQAFLFTSGMWLTLSLFAALPFMWGPAKLSFTDAIFESVSGLTTTGASVMSGLDTMAPGTLLWRMLLHWYGGIGIVVLAIAILPLLSIGGMQLFRTESSDKSEKFMPRVGAIAKGLLLSYVILTFLCALSYLAAGMEAFDAVTLAMSTLSSGGFANSDSSIGVFASPAVDYVAIVFMLLASLPFTLYVRALAGDMTRLFTNSEVRLFLCIVAFFALALFTIEVMTGVAEGEAAFRGALFTVTSLISTTGFMSVDYTHWGPLSDALIFVLLFLGGCTGSTAGGLKAMRIAIAGKAVGQHLKRINYRNGVFPIRYGGAPVSDEVVGSVLGFICLYFGTFLVGGVLLNMMGLDMRTAFSATIACLSNSGPGLGPSVGPASNYAGLPDAAIWVLSVLMLLGRLEILTVLVLFLPRFWLR